MEDNGCPQCEVLARSYYTKYGCEASPGPLCLDCQKDIAMNEMIERLKKRENDNASV